MRCKLKSGVKSDRFIQMHGQSGRLPSPKRPAVQGRDHGIPVTVGMLAIFGLIMIYSASSYTAQKELSDSFYFVKKQLLGLGVGIVAFVCLALFDYRKFPEYAIPILIGSAVLLGMVFVPFVGVESLGARRWIGVGSFTLQPSEVAKFGYVIFCACYLSKSEHRIRTVRGMLPILLTGLTMCALILAEPNMSITVCVAVTMMIMLFVGGARIKHLVLMALPLLICVPLLILAEPYRMKRLLAFLDPWASPKNEGYQLIQSLYALGSGGWFGVGLFQSRQKYEFLPFAESDFIFSVIGEELGLVGCLAVIGLFLFLICRGILIAVRAKDRLGCYLALGIIGVIAVQVLVNIAVVTGSIPPTGLPLPFISYGGSSLAVFLGASGILYRISGG